MDIPSPIIGVVLHRFIELVLEIEVVNSELGTPVEGADNRVYLIGSHQRLELVIHQFSKGLDFLD